MPHAYPSFPPNLQQWALEQPLFCTASAPLRGKHVNLSPKGVPATTFAVLDANRAAYLDFAASGAETIAHIYENGRVTVMFCSFGPKPRILRLYCTGRVIEYDDAQFHPMIRQMGLAYIPGVRAVIVLDIWKVLTSCGYAVPLLVDGNNNNNNSNHAPHHPHTLAGANQAIQATGRLTAAPCPCFQDRHLLEEWLVNKTNKRALDDYMAFWNARSVDGLPGLRAARALRGERLWVGDVRAWAAKTLDYPAAVLLGVLLGVLLALSAPLLARSLARSLARIGAWAWVQDQPSSPARAWLRDEARVLARKLCLCLKIVLLQAHRLRERMAEALSAPSTVA